MQFKKTKLATAVGTAALAMSLSGPANSAVIVGGDGGWEVSFGGTINLFMNFNDIELSGAGATANNFGSEEGVHLQEGLLPAFFTFKAKSPTVNGLTGTAQISFAPDSSSAKNTRQDKGGNAIDMREVFFNVDGSFGTISAGRTLGLFSRQAILKDQTLFGVGWAPSNDAGGTTLGRIGMGYVYPEFRTRFSYTTPDVNGFQLEVGVFDPQEPFLTGGTSTGAAGLGLSGGNVIETDIPMFQAEAQYKTSFQGGDLHFFASGLWQEMERKAFGAAGLSGEDITSYGWNIGADATFGGFNLWGHYYDGEALGNVLKWAGGTLTTSYLGGPGAVVFAPGYMCTFGGCAEADNDGFIVQGSYTFNGKTKLAISYGESNQDSQNIDSNSIYFNEVEHDMWTVGVYHDVTSWLKVVAEYNDSTAECSAPSSFGGPAGGAACTTNPELETQTFSVGGFIFW